MTSLRHLSPLAALLFLACPTPTVNPPPPTPALTLSATAVDFGRVGCGRQGTQTVTLTNPGAEAVSYEVRVTGAGFAATPSSGQVEAGATATVTLTADVPATSAAGATGSGTAQVVVTGGATHELTLQRLAVGARFTLTPTVASFGVVPVNTQAPALPLTLENTGNEPVTLRFAQPQDTQFTLAWTGAPADVTVAAGASVPGLEARFLPSSNTSSTGMAALTVDGPVCGTSVASISMTGQGTSGVVALSTSDVFFGDNGLVDCGGQSPSRTLTLSNAGNMAYAWTATLGRGASSPFTVTPSSGTVPANGGMQTLTFTSTAIPAATPTAPDAFGDVLTIVTDAANDVPHPVALHQTARGAILSWAQAEVDFGLVPIGSTSTAPISLVNEGNVSPELSLLSSNTKFTLPGGALVVATGGATTTSGGLFDPGTSVLPETALLSLSLDAGTVLCAPAPAALPLKGQGTSGSVSYSPAALDFGAVNCGTAGAPQTITFRNNGNQAYTVTAALGRDAGATFDFTVAPADGVVAPDGGTVVITVTPRAIPQTSAVTANLYGDVLQLATDVVGDTPRDVPLRLTARGSIFAVSTSSLNFGSVPRNATGSAQFTVSNSGNAAGALVFTPGQPTIFSMPANALVGANASSGEVATFSPPGIMTYSDTATVAAASGTVLCQPLPLTTVSLTGIGTAANVMALSANNLNFGQVSCGATGTAQTVTVTNNSGQALNLTYALAGGSSSPFTVSGPTSVASGAAATVTVTPKAIPSTADTTADAFSDTLSITGAGTTANETQTVQLRETARGAVLRFQPTALSFNATLGGSQSRGFTVGNSGNAAAGYTLTVGGTNPGNFSVSPQSGTAAAGSSGSHTATYTAPTLGGTRSGNVSLATTATLCAPLPAALTLSGSN